jgi:hypothetical protein
MVELAGILAHHLFDYLLIVQYHANPCAVKDLFRMFR